jgi:hypothetical protein
LTWRSTLAFVWRGCEWQRVEFKLGWVGDWEEEVGVEGREVYAVLYNMP